jgi:hypothetical protein
LKDNKRAYPSGETASSISNTKPTLYAKTIRDEQRAESEGCTSDHPPILCTADLALPEAGDDIAGKPKIAQSLTQRDRPLVWNDGDQPLDLGCGSLNLDKCV